MSSHTTANRKIKLTNFIQIQNKKLNKNYLHHFVRRENVKNLNVLIAKLVPWFCMLLNLKMVDLFIQFHNLKMAAICMCNISNYFEVLEMAYKSI